MSKLSEEFVKNCTALDTARDAGLSTPKDVERFDDIIYDQRGQTLDVYRPKGIGSALPVIVSVHGGGWVYGSKEVYQFYCMSLAQRGFAVVNFNYRLAPEHKFPAAVEDTNSVFHWVLSHAEEYAFDTERIFAVGDSAGAQNLAIYACILVNNGYAKRFPFAVPEGLNLRALGLNCGMFDLRENCKLSFIGDALEQGGTAYELETMSPAAFVTPDFPPSFLLTATDDFLREDSAEFAELLKKNGVPFVHKVYGDGKEPLYHVFHCNARSDIGKKANDEECEFFRRYF